MRYKSHLRSPFEQSYGEGERPKIQPIHAGTNDPIHSHIRRLRGAFIGLYIHLHLELNCPEVEGRCIGSDSMLELEQGYLEGQRDLVSKLDSPYGPSGEVRLLWILKTLL